MFRSTETFALTRRRFRDFRPLIPPSSYASPLLCALGHALARRARVRRRSTHVRQPSACRLPTRFARPPLHFPTRQFHVEHVRTIPAHNQERVRHAPGLTLSLRSLVSASLRRRRLYADTSPLSNPRRRAGFTTHVFHVKPLSTDQSPPALLRPGACRARAVSGVCISAFVRPRPEMRRRTHHFPLFYP